MLSLVLAGLSGYLLGSIPTAYLLVQWFSKVDIRQTGSGNVGTLNSYLVTRSKIVGGAVLLGDLLKGVAAVWLARVSFGGQFDASAMAAAGAVLGHNYPVWLRFKGGRGLATGAGALVFIAPLVIGLWGLVWVGGFLILRKVNVANALASIVAALLLLLAPGGWLTTLFTSAAETWHSRIFALVFFGIILSRHREPVAEFLHDRQSKKEVEREK